MNRGTTQHDGCATDNEHQTPIRKGLPQIGANAQQTQRECHWQEHVRPSVPREARD